MKKLELTLVRAEYILNNLGKLPHKVFWRRRLKSYFCHIVCEFVFYTGIDLYNISDITVNEWREREKEFNPRLRYIIDIYLKYIHIGGEILIITPYSLKQLDGIISRKLKRYGVTLEELRLVGLYKVIQGL